MMRKYIWQAGIRTPHDNEIVIVNAAKLLKYKPTNVAWASCGTAAILRDAPLTSFIDEASREYMLTSGTLFPTGAFMRVPTIANEMSRWDRCNVPMIIWNPESDWVPGYIDMKRYTQGKAEFICGNVGWGKGYADQKHVNDLRLFGDSLECYYRPFGPGRTTLDWLQISAFLAEVGKPYYAHPNAWSDSAKVSMPLAEYDKVMSIIAESPGCNGIGAWAWDSLPDDLINRWNAFELKTPRIPRWQISLTANASPDSRADVAKFRMAYYAGQVCAARLPFEVKRLPLLDSYFPAGCCDHVHKFYAGELTAAQVEVIERGHATKILAAITK
jgi:hypothetical protein